MNEQERLIKELLKTYHILNTFDTKRASEALQALNTLRLEIALEAEIRQNFYQQINIAANGTGFVDDYFFARGDIRSLVKRGIASLMQGVLIDLTHQGIRRNVITRESVAWQQLFSDVQTAVDNGQQIPFDLPQEIYLKEQESLNISVEGQTAAGFIIMHGCNLKDDYSPNVAELKAEIETRDFDGELNLPQTQLIPLIYEFSGVAGTYATDISGNEQIYSVKSDKSTILAGVSTTGLNCRLSLFDEGRNHEFCDLVEMRGIASLDTNPFNAYYPLSYPHLLRKQDRLKIRVLNGSNISATHQEINTPNYLTFHGWTM